MHMRMTFDWSSNLGLFFFDGLNINSVTSLAIVCGIFGLFSIVYEGIKVYTASVRARTAREQIAAVSCAPSESANLIVTDANANRSSFSKRFFKLFGEATVFFFHNTLGYALMLAVMAYNGWLFVAVVLCMGLGYFLFGHISMKINMENVQARTTRIVCSPSCTAETGNSVTDSKTSSPCRIVPGQPEQYYQQQYPDVPVATTSSSTQGTCSTVTAECHAPKMTEEVAEGDCSCRL